MQQGAKDVGEFIIRRIFNSRKLAERRTQVSMLENEPIQFAAAVREVNYIRVGSNPRRDICHQSVHQLLIRYHE